MSTEAYQQGYSAGGNRANYAVAYENVLRWEDAPEVTDIPGFVDVSTNQNRWDYERGFSDGRDHYMSEDYPE